MTANLDTRAWALGLKHIDNWEGIFAPTRAAIMDALMEALREPPPPAPLPDERERWKLEECAHEIRAALAGTHVRIWSGEHHAYWRPASSGYTADSLSAGVFEFSDAWRRTRHCGPEKRIAFEPVTPTAIAQPKGKGQ